MGKSSCHDAEQNSVHGMREKIITNDLDQCHTKRVKEISLFPPNPEVMVARHKEDMLEFLDHQLKGASQDALVIRDVSSKN